MARILLETTSNKMPGGHEIAPALAALYKADGDLHPESWQSYIPDPERGMPRENMRRLLNDHVDATYDESGRSRFSREDTAYAVMDIFSTIVEANPQGLTMNANVTAWIDSMAATYHSVFEPASDHPA